MSLIKTYNFIDEEDFTDTAKIADGSLILLNDPDNDFNEDFADDTDFTYDSDLAEFSGGQVQQINKRPTNGILYASFDTDEDAAWTEIGTGVGTLSDGATVHDGLLDLTGYIANRRLSIEAYNTSHNSQKGCMRCRFKPNYSGAPSQLQYIMQWRDGGLENNIQVLQNTSRFMQAWIRDGAGSNILATASFGVFDFVADQVYEIEFNWDCDTGEHRLFIDGIQQGTTQSGTGTRDSRVDQFDFGVYYNNAGQPNFSILDFIYFDDVQHTANYTPDWSDIYEYDYVESEVVLPEMEYTGAGTLIEATDFVTSITGSPRLTIEIGRSGDELYWNGSAWAVSNETYAQATSPADFLTNIASLPVNGEIYGQFKIYFTDSNTQSSFADLTITLTAQIYATDNPYIIPNSTIGINGISNIVETVIKSGNDDISRVCVVDGSPYYHDGSDWVISDYSYAQSNTITEILAAIDDLVGNGITSFLMAYIFHSDDGTTTPTISTDIITYDFFGGVEDAPSECIVYGTMRDEDGNPVENGVVTISPSNTKALYNNNQLTLSQKTVLTRANGYWEVTLPETTNMDIHFIFTFSNDNTHRGYPRIIQNEDTKEFGDLIAPS